MVTPLGFSEDDVIEYTEGSCGFLASVMHLRYKWQVALVVPSSSTSAMNSWCHAALWAGDVIVDITGVYDDEAELCDQYQYHGGGSTIKKLTTPEQHDRWLKCGYFETHYPAPTGVVHTADILHRRASAACQRLTKVRQRA